MKPARTAVATVGVAVAALGWVAAPATQSVGTGQMSFDRYHSYPEIVTYLQSVTRAYDELTTLIEIGRSRANRPIYAVEINNPRTGPAAEKPGFYIDGNIHGGEVLGGEAALYLIDRLLGDRERDEAVRTLVDDRAFFIVPIVNPDGRVLSVSTPENHRWNIRPMDEDGDGRRDEDPPEDLDGDGRLLRMRWPDPDGSWAVSTLESRLMVRRRPGMEGPFYRVETEGIDNDGDGRFSEDRVGGVDLNRNFPSNWSPSQFASGPYPLSEPETHALVDYITSRPTIAAIHTFHTSGGLLLRFPTLADQNWDFPRSDLEDYDAIARRGVELTGYDNYAYRKEPIVNLMSPGHGVFNDWASNVFGVLAMTTEMWKHPMQRTGTAIFAWNDDVLDGAGFIDWQPFSHPQLGMVELGGWDRWSLSSPPEPLIAAELERNARWVISFAERLPRVVIVDSRVDAASDGYRVEVVAGNSGWMSTTTAHARDILGIARPVEVSMTLENARIVDGDSTQTVGFLAGARDGRAVAASPVRWLVRGIDPTAPARVTVTVHSEKAGTVRRVLTLSGR